MVVLRMAIEVMLKPLSLRDVYDKDPRRRGQEWIVCVCWVEEANNCKVFVS